MVKKTDIFYLKIFSQISGVKSPILAATYEYLTNAAGGLLTDISAILADIILDIVHDMLNENTFLHKIYLMQNNDTKTAIQLIDQVGLDFVQAVLNQFLAQEVNVAEILGKPGMFYCSVLKQKPLR